MHSKEKVICMKVVKGFGLCLFVYLLGCICAIIHFRCQIELVTFWCKWQWPETTFCSAYRSVCIFHLCNRILFNFILNLFKEFIKMEYFFLCVLSSFLLLFFLFYKHFIFFPYLKFARNKMEVKKKQVTRRKKTK